MPEEMTIVFAWNLRPVNEERVIRDIRSIRTCSPAAEWDQTVLPHSALNLGLNKVWPPENEANMTGTMHQEEAGRERTIRPL